jgi:hypothetical protein
MQTRVLVTETRDNIYAYTLIGLWFAFMMGLDMSFIISHGCDIYSDTTKLAV